MTEQDEYTYLINWPDGTQEWVNIFHLRQIHDELLEALRAMLREHGPIPEGLYNGGRCECGACTQAREIIRCVEEQA